MSWIIQCPTHGKVITEYRCEGMIQLENTVKRTLRNYVIFEDPDRDGIYLK